MAEIIWQYLNLGRLTPIAEALKLQEELFQQKLAGDPGNYVLFAEHEPVYTCTPREMRRTAWRLLRVAVAVTAQVLTIAMSALCPRCTGSRPSDWRTSRTCCDSY